MGPVAPLRASMNDADLARAADSDRSGHQLQAGRPTLRPLGHDVAGVRVKRLQVGRREELLDLRPR